MVAGLRTLPPADPPLAEDRDPRPTPGLLPGLPVPQRILFAAIGWVPAVALVLGMFAAFGPATPARGPAEQSVPARGPIEQADPVASVKPAGQGESVEPGGPAAGAAQRPAVRTLLHRGGTGNYTGSQVTAAADVRMSVTYRVTCRSGPPFLTVSWDGAGPDFDYLTVSGALRMSGAGHLDPVAPAGRFEVRTRDDCAWIVLVTQQP